MRLVSYRQATTSFAEARYYTLKYCDGGKTTLFIILVLYI